MSKKPKPTPTETPTTCQSSESGCTWRQWRKLQHEALDLFDTDLERARSLLLQQLSLNPSHPIPLYNLACVESRLNNHTSALSYLEKAITCGYSNVQHMEEDTDLDNIRDLEGYKKLIDELKSKPAEKGWGGCGRGWGRGRGWRKYHMLAIEIRRLFEKGSREDLEAARELLKQQCALRPYHCVPIYNMACVEARLGNACEAMDYLTKAVNSGMNDVDHIERDSDLVSLRHLEEYQKLVSLLKNQQVSAPVPSQSTPAEIHPQPNSVAVQQPQTYSGTVQQPQPNSVTVQQPQTNSASVQQPQPKSPPQPNPISVQSPPISPVQSQPTTAVRVPSNLPSVHPHPWDWWGNLQPMNGHWDFVRRQVNEIFGFATLNQGDYVQDEEQFQALLESFTDKL